MTDNSTATPTPPPSGGGVFSAHDPVLVFVLNLLLFGGIGYWILGQKQKAIVAIVLFFVVAWPTCFSASGLIALICAVDGYMQAKALEEGRTIGQWTFL
ncbi:MAG: hypothetical protein ACTHQM_13175 [Thermoanaerobaculia bacterium]